MKSIKKYWALGLALLGGIALYLISAKFRQSGGTPKRQIDLELKAIDREIEVRQIEAKIGTEATKRAIKDEYQAKKAKLTEKQIKQAQKFKHDPAALAAWLVKVG